MFALWRNDGMVFVLQQIFIIEWVMHPERSIEVFLMSLGLSKPNVDSTFTLLKQQHQHQIVFYLWPSLLTTVQWISGNIKIHPNEENNCTEKYIITIPKKEKKTHETRWNSTLMCLHRCLLRLWTVTFMSRTFI